ncbi:hypothetical protein ACFSJ3_17915 [Corallincola platygyrae]|uniref:DNA polymerase III subunit psi n=1 Tax=Corallincola platygyrae TaxID=1193278 RepID=A0ABW4XQQ2_9GAMM
MTLTDLQRQVLAEMQIDETVYVNHNVDRADVNSADHLLIIADDPNSISESKLVKGVAVALSLVEIDVASSSDVESANAGLLWRMDGTDIGLSDRELVTPSLDVLSESKALKQKLWQTLSTSAFYPSSAE